MLVVRDVLVFSFERLKGGFFKVTLVEEETTLELLMLAEGVVSSIGKLLELCVGGVICTAVNDDDADSVLLVVKGWNVFDA
jgi:hypothetical protein